jgi:hypothetical protein
MDPVAMSVSPAAGSPTPAEFRAAVTATREPPDEGNPAVTLGQALRALNRSVVGSTAPDDVVADVTAGVERLTERLAAYAHPSRYEQAQAVSGTGTFLNHPMIGPANPCAPPIQMHIEGDALVGEVTFSTPQEGPPGHGYGGYLAAGFDAILLMTAGINGLGGPTRSLAVRYRRPTPLHIVLRYTARIEAVEERSVRIRGALVGEDGTVYVEGEAEVARGARIGDQFSPPASPL